ncbi:hypothetical protein ACVWZV_000449 [Bradyrhizobium sp. GM5.1]
MKHADLDGVVRGFRTRNGSQTKHQSGGRGENATAAKWRRYIVSGFAMHECLISLTQT